MRGPDLPQRGGVDQAGISIDDLRERRLISSPGEGLEQLRVLEHGFPISTVEATTDTIGVDTPEDLERVRKLVETSSVSRAQP